MMFVHMFSFAEYTGHNGGQAVYFMSRLCYIIPFFTGSTYILCIVRLRDNESQVQSCGILLHMSYRISEMVFSQQSVCYSCWRLAKKTSHISSGHYPLDSSHMNK